MITLLQNLTNSSSNNVIDLYHLFKNMYPHESGCITMLQDFLFNDNDSLFTESDIIEVLTNIKIKSKN